MTRFTDADVATWRRDGVALIHDFFTPEEVAAVAADFEIVFGKRNGSAEALDVKQPGEVGRFNQAQFKSFEAIPFECSPALNLIGVHEAPIAFAKAALECDDVQLYQCQAWAKYTGDADYDQPFHCDYVNHTLTAPSDDARKNCVTILCYFTDVSEAHGAMHYVRRSDSERMFGPDATLGGEANLQAKLRPFERSSAAPAGTAIPYSIDVFHRGTNITAAHAHRYAVMICYKRAGDESIGYHAWQFHHMKPWRRIFEHATPEQLACFGVQKPGDPFWNEATLRRAQQRYPGWDMTPYRAALR